MCDSEKMFIASIQSISKIEYNFLNLPKTVVVDGKQVTYIYRADGTKIKKIFENTTTDYLDGFQYETQNNATKLLFFPTAEGYADYQNLWYVYNYTDHLGNVRLSYADANRNGIAEATEILEQSNYYPFGLLHASTPSKLPNKYKYNRKEIQEEIGMYDYGARFYMPELGRWGVVDPLAEMTNEPYSYVYNNPMRFMDPDGRKGVTNIEEVVITKYTGGGYSGSSTVHFSSFFDFGGIDFSGIDMMMKDSGGGGGGSGGSGNGGSSASSGNSSVKRCNLQGEVGHCAEIKEVVIKAKRKPKESNVASNFWNSSFARHMVSDVFTVGLSTEVAMFLGVGTTPVNLSLLTRGKDKGLYFTPTISGSVGTGGEVSVGLNLSSGWYTGDPRTITKDMLKGHSFGISVGAGLGFNGSVGASYAPVDMKNPITGGGFINTNVSFGLGIQGSPFTAVNGQLNYQYTPVVQSIVKF